MSNPTGVAMTSRSYPPTVASRAPVYASAIRSALRTR